MLSFSSCLLLAAGINEFLRIMSKLHIIYDIIKSIRPCVVAFLLPCYFFPFELSGINLKI